MKYTSDRGLYQNNVSALSNLSDYDYEQIFKLYQDPANKTYFYNILKTVNIPNKIPQQLFYTYKTEAQEPLTAMSFKHYKTIKLWWLICAVNQIHNPVKFIPAGSVLKIPRPSYVMDIINTIKRSLVD